VGFGGADFDFAGADFVAADFALVDLVGLVFADADLTGTIDFDLGDLGLVAGRAKCCKASERWVAWVRGLAVLALARLG